MGRIKSVATIKNNLKKALKGYNKGQDINKYEKYIYLILFYRYLSENIVSYLNDEFKINYIQLTNKEAEAYKNKVQDLKDYFIYPEDLFQNIAAKNLNDSRLDSILNSVFQNIKQSSKHDICDIFRNIDTTNESIGINQNLRSEIYSNLLRAISEIDYDVHKSEYDLFGNIFEFLLNTNDTNNRMSLSNGIFYTQPSLVKLLKKIADQYITNPTNVYDPTCGSGSLLSEYAKYNNSISYYGKELNEIPSMLCRMNLILHNVNNFEITQCDTLMNYDETEKNKYDLILSNPPFGIPWDKQSLRSDDERFNNKPLPGNSYGDWAFIYHIIYTLNNNGLALTIDTPKMLSRANQEETEVKKYLVENNQIDAIILLPKKLFLRTDTGTCLFLFRKNKTDNNILFVDATNICTKNSNQITLSDTNIDNIIELVINRQTLDNLSYLANPEEIKNKGYSLNISDYVNYNKEYTFKNINTGRLSQFIYVDEEEKNYNLRIKYNEDIRKTKQIIEDIVNNLKIENKIKMIPIDEVANVKQGTKLKDLKIETNDRFPNRFITSKEIQDGSVIPDTPLMYLNSNIKTTRIREEDVQAYINKGNLKNDDVLFTFCSSGVKTAIVENPNYIISDTITRLRVKLDVEDVTHPIYLRYILESDFFLTKVNKYLKKYDNNTNSPSYYIPVGDLKNITIPVIPLDEQLKICNLLALMEIEYKKLELSLKREIEIYKYRYYQGTKMAFNDLENE